MCKQAREASGTGMQYRLIVFYSMYFFIMHVCVLGCVRLFATPWTIAQQTPLFMEFSRQE